MKKTKILIVVCVLLIVTVLLTSCAQTKLQSSPTEDEKSTPEPSSSSEAESIPEESANQYPEKLTIWCGGFSEKFSSLGATDYNACRSFQAITEATGTQIEWLYGSSANDGATNLNLMIASKELPDLMVYNWKNVPGGVEQFYEDGYIIDLTDLYTTNLSNVYKALENVDALGHIKATDGKYYYIPEVSDTKGSGVYLGFVIRQDMLDELNVKTPTTLDEYHALLTQAKEHYGKDFYPMTGSSFKNVALGIGNLLWAFGITSDLYLDGDTVCYGPMSGRFADAMGYIQKLYAEGLIDPDYATQDRNAEKGKMMSDSSMVTFEFQPTAMMTAMADVNPKFKLVGITNLKETADSKPYTFDSNYNSVLQYGDDVAITTSCEDPVKACNFMNYIFSEEGYNITNYGVEHTSWEFDANGKPQFNDAYAAIDNAEGVLYNFGAASVFPSLRSYETYKYSLSETAAAAIETWRSTNDTSKILPVVTLTQEETDAISDDFTDINTYMDEVYAKLVNGQMSISDIPNVQQKLKEMNIDKIVAAYQAAYDRYK